jgi:hypothetical protein
MSVGCALFLKRRRRRKWEYREPLHLRIEAYYCAMFWIDTVRNGNRYRDRQIDMFCLGYFLSPFYVIIERREERRRRARRPVLLKGLSGFHKKEVVVSYSQGWSPLLSLFSLLYLKSCSVLKSRGFFLSLFSKNLNGITCFSRGLQESIRPRLPCVKAGPVM